MSIARFEKTSEKQFKEDLCKLFGIDDDSYKNVTIPKRATAGSAGYDFVTPVSVTLKPGEMKIIPTGIRSYIEEGYVLHIYPRSSLGFKYQLVLANTTGIIDADYYNAKNEGHIMIALVNKGTKEVTLNAGERFAQGIFLKFYTAEEEEVKTLRTGGIGSSN